MTSIFAEFTSFKFGMAFISFATCLMIIVMKHRVPRINGRPGVTSAVQAAHSRVTPRIGGVGVGCAVGIGILLSPTIGTEAHTGIFGAAALLFAVGLAEDLGFLVSPRNRLLATLAASLLAVGILGHWLPRVDVPFMDPLLRYWFFGIPFTLLLTAGVANGFNLIDGVNGLAATTGMVAALALSSIALNVGYDAMVHAALLLAAGLLGFLLLNYPFGLIFLGDAGAYTAGFILAWIGIAIVVFSPLVSAWAVLLTMFWPLADTLIAMFRRRHKSGATMSPDRLHAHQLVMRALEICWLGRSNRHISNPVSTLVLLPFVIAPPITGVALWNQSLPAFLAVFFYCALFAISYLLGGRIVRRLRRKTYREGSVAKLKKG